ncbi:hypothetical protein B0T21DRAFT_376809 [Apiosordaria backusii]|uniref:Uncharacterized protein n=1 Tax=Apiosordaria backusii TaxID=314023 RepID=A0AA40A762_9PEZI|nr:hypothetical protein B0T21DRAFT_376809 [Apiosordaria backusii]
MDIPGSSKQSETKCVVLGRTRGISPEERICYFILVRAVAKLKQSVSGTKVYKRVGAGYLPGRYMSGNAVKVTIH